MAVKGVSQLPDATLTLFFPGALPESSAPFVMSQSLLKCRLLGSRGHKSHSQVPNPRTPGDPQALRSGEHLRRVTLINWGWFLFTYNEIMSPLS